MPSPESQPTERFGRQHHFGEFTLDLDAGFLRRGSEEVTLRPKAFEVLAYLVQHHGRLVTKIELIESVWPDAAVTDNSLAQSLLEIRRALADDSQQMIRTIKGRGYVFAAPLRTAVVEFPSKSGGVGMQPSAAPAQVRSLAWTSRSLVLIGALTVSLVIGAGAIRLLRRAPPAPHQASYEQLTNFPDSALAPALSPDGRIVAFYRSDSWFLTPDQIYVKMLPDGEPVQLTNDNKWKYGLTFSPGGSRIAYTTSEGGPSGWKTYTVSVLGGEPTLLLSNAAGLSWLDQGRLLFSEIRRGEHMGLVTAAVNRSDYRQIYFPANERGMVHSSYVSPDRNWVLVTEMEPAWLPCRLIPMDGSSAGRLVGPEGACLSAAWSPDGKWMYFGVEAKGENHLWRQRFPNGTLEQITFGPTHQEGLAMAPDGRSLITSIGVPQSVLWIHDQRGDRPITTEGLVVAEPGWTSSVKFTSDGKRLFYLMRRESPSSPAQLWRIDLESGKNELIMPGFSMVGYDISSDDQEVVFSTQPSDNVSQIWLAPLDRSSPPRLIGSTASSAFPPYFGPDSRVLFVMREGTTNYLASMNRDGSDRSKVVPDPISGIYGGVSPDRRWVAVSMPAPDIATGAIVAVATNGGAQRRICGGFRPVSWSPDGKFFYIGIRRSSRSSLGMTLAIPLRPGESLPDLPASGIRGPADPAAFPGSHVIEGWTITPGQDQTVAYVKAAMNRNLFRIPFHQ